MGSPLGLAGIFFDLLARTHLQHSWSLVALLFLDRFLTPLQKEQFAQHFLQGTHLQHSWSLHCLWLHLLLLDRCLTGPAKEQFAHHFLQEDRFGPEEIVPKWRSFLGGISTTPEQEISSYAELWHPEVWLTVPKSCIALNWMDPLMHVWARPWASPVFFLIF